MSFDSESDYECDMGACRRGSLDFNPVDLEKVILSMCDKFDVRVVLSDERSRRAAAVTARLSLAGVVLGRRYAGNIGAVIGGALGGVVGLGFVAVSMRDIWEEVKGKLSLMIEVLYDYLATHGVEDYAEAAQILTNDQGLAMLLLDCASHALDKKILSSLTES